MSQSAWINKQNYIATPDMRIVPLGSSITNSKHLRIPLNRVIRWWGLLYFAAQTKKFHSYYIVNKNQDSMELYTGLYHTELKHALEERHLCLLGLESFCNF